MKKSILTIVGIILLFPCMGVAEDFLGVPLIPDGEILKKTNDRLEMTTDLSHDQALAFYKETLKKQADIKFRDWKDVTYIEDDGKLAWHSITISKAGTPKTTIIIIKDNWTWIIGTLIIRFLGVFIVLIILFITLYLSGRVISHYFKKAESHG